MYRIDTLLKQDRKLFHTRDLALLWNISNDNTLYTTIKRYIQKGILISIQKGFYATVSLDNIDPVLLGLSFLHTYSYLSTESVLIANGVIFQAGNKITLVSNVSTKFTIGKNIYLVRKMKDKFLYNTNGVKESGLVRIASLERAAVDMLYFQKKFHFDNPSRINWGKVKALRTEAGFP